MAIVLKPTEGAVANLRFISPCCGHRVRAGSKGGTGQSAHYPVLHFAQLLGVFALHFAGELRPLVRCRTRLRFRFFTACKNPAPCESDYPPHQPTTLLPAAVLVWLARRPCSARLAAPRQRLGLRSLRSLHGEGSRTRSLALP